MALHMVNNSVGFCKDKLFVPGLFLSKCWMKSFSSRYMAELVLASYEISHSPKSHLSNKF